MSTGPDRLRALDAWLDGAALLGAELEPRYRVLGLTFELARPPTGLDPADPRLLVLLSPCAELQVLLTEGVEGRRVIRRFTTEQLPDVVAALGEPVVGAPLFGPGVPQLATQVPELSLHGRSDAPDGRTHHIELVVDDGASLTLRLAASFDEVELRDPTGEVLDPDG